MIEGVQIIGFEAITKGNEKFSSFDPVAGKHLSYEFTKATDEEVDLAVRKATNAFQVYRKISGLEKATFLESIAHHIAELGDELIDVCCQETALPRARLEGERMRTINQLKMFVDLLREGSWVDARIETAIPDRKPVPKPDLRYMEIALGPVVVFGASNFPLAFSVAGGDTASALAAGCPVIVKAHSAHPATSELVGKAIIAAARECNMPDGVFSLLHGDGPVVGMALVKHPDVKAVGLTGSYAAGRALFDAASSRPVPIPVYAEMGSTNPVFILPEAMENRKESIAQGFVGSVTLGVGQFCTNPGLLVCQRNSAATDFIACVAQVFSNSSGGVMLTKGIYQAYLKGIGRHSRTPGVSVVSRGSGGAGSIGVEPVLLTADADTFARNPELAEEIFGPASLIVEAGSKDDFYEIAKHLSGHLTVTVHGTENDLVKYRDLIEILEQKAGRLVINGFPTGVEVCHSMVHGGPFPATTDARSTSVGTAAIYRFTRPVSYQGMPDTLLPDELRNGNPLNIWRMVNGSMSKNEVM